MGCLFVCLTKTKCLLKSSRLFPSVFVKQALPSGGKHVLSCRNPLAENALNKLFSDQWGFQKEKAREHKCKSPKLPCINTIMKPDSCHSFSACGLRASKVPGNGDASTALMDQSIAQITLGWLGAHCWYKDILLRNIREGFYNYHGLVTSK